MERQTQSRPLTLASLAHRVEDLERRIVLLERSLGQLTARVIADENEIEIETEAIETGE